MLLILAASPLETGLLRKHVRDAHTFYCATNPIVRGKIGGEDILLAHGGIGQVNMAIHLTRLLNAHTPVAVFLCGCGGSYPDSNLHLGDLTLAESEFFADLGVATEEKFIPLEQLDLPQDPQLSPVIQQSFTLNPELLNRAQKILPDVISGPFVTVNCCSSHPGLSIELQQRSSGICENMEGAAAAQVCAEFAVPLLELRGISNPTGTRDSQQWDVVRGAEAAQTGILKLLDHWSET
jgi:futalosine hydrolase